MTAPADIDRVAEVLAGHVWWPGTPRDGAPGCYCGWRCPVGEGTSRHDQHAEHVAEALAPLIEALIARYAQTAGEA